MEPNELVLSETHSKRTWIPVSDDRASTRYPFRIVSEERDDDVPSSNQRNRVIDSDVIVVRHALATPLSHVGLQVWSGCLFMADFFFSQTLGDSSSRVWMELGAGTGLCGVAAAFARRQRPLTKVYCTDIGGDVGRLCIENLRRNRPMLRERNVDTEMIVAEVNFLNLDLDAKLPLVTVGDDSSSDTSSSSTLRQIVAETQVFYAADVVFDADVTEAFFQLLIEFLVPDKSVNDLRTRDLKTCYVALEKRIVFSLEDDDEPSAPLYDHFRACLEGLLDIRFDFGHFKARQIPGDFSQSFYNSYERTINLEMWEIAFELKDEFLE